MERRGSRVQCAVSLGKKCILHNNTWGHFLFSFDNFQMCLDQINQKDDLLFISAPFAPAETGPLVPQFCVECRSIGVKLNRNTWFPSSFVSCVHFHVTCEKAFRPDLGLWQHGPSRFLQLCLFPTTRSFLSLQRSRAESHPELLQLVELTPFLSSLSALS